MTADLGLALSGGGSRAAAFHRGTLRALGELGLTERVRVISSVSGGSVFAAAWMAARARGDTDDAFLAWMKQQLARGFIRPALLHWRALKMLSPGWSRTQRLAETFDEVLFRGVSWDQLPAQPRLCLNTSVLNNASSGRFSQGGYSGEGVGPRGEDGYPEGPIRGATLGFATAASAAFPFGLPPLSVAADRLAFPLQDELASHDRLVFTDGGIIENLGIERLLQSRRFGTRHVIVSDAGVRDTAWQPSLFGKLKSAAIFGLSAQILERLLLVMNDKQNRSMRQLLYAKLSGEARDPDRTFLFVRAEQDWDRLLASIPGWRLAELGIAEAAPREAASREAALERAGIELDRARTIFRDMGGARAAAAANRVVTNFTGLSGATLDLLEAHARWQLHLAAALYGKPHLVV